MKVETREDALLHCFDLWIWLAVTGKRDKKEWPGWKIKGGYLESCTDECPACEVSTTCEYCIIRWRVIGDCTDSEFDDWCYAPDTKNRSEVALKIASLALEALTE